MTVSSTREDIEGACFSSLRKVVDEAPYLGRRAEENLVAQKRIQPNPIQIKRFGVPWSPGASNSILAWPWPSCCVIRRTLGYLLILSFRAP